MDRTHVLPPNSPAGALISSHWLKLQAMQFRNCRADVELAALLPNAVELIPAVEEVLAKKAENRRYHS